MVNPKILDIYFLLYGLFFSGDLFCVNCKIFNFNKPRPSQKQYAAINFDNVNLYWHRLTITSILKAKAKTLLADDNIPQIEKTLYNLCSRESDSPVKLAKCVVNLIKARDLSRYNQKMLYYYDFDTEEGRHDMFKDQLFRGVKSLLLSSNQKGNILEKPNRLLPIREFYQEDKSRRRRKRESFDYSQRPGKFKNINNLRILQEYMALTRKSSDYMERINRDNQAFAQSQKMPVDVQIKHNDNEVNQMFSFIDNLANQKYSVLSPQVMPFMGSGKKRPNLLSPTLLSFNRDGFFSLPDILQAANPGKTEQDAWLDMLLDITGAGRKLSELVQKLAPDLAHMKSKIIPAVEKMETLEKRFAILKQTFSREQEDELLKNGYAFMDPDQMAFVHGHEQTTNTYIMSKEEHEEKLERNIHELAKLDANEILKPTSARRRRQAGADGEMFEEWNVLKPFAFVNRFNETVVWEALILSPHAFFTELIVTDIMVTDVLSPRAFKPSILSPAILLSRILSPLAFGAEVLSPRMLVAFILSPQVLLAEILSPQLLEIHIASPDFLTVQVLTPNILSPRIMSPAAYGILVLSPNILSPRIMSQERMLVEILSPHVLGGEETEEEEESNFHHESDLPEIHRHHKHSQGLQTTDWVVPEGATAEEQAVLDVALPHNHERR